MVHQLDSVCRDFLCVEFLEVSLRGFSDVLLEDHVLVPSSEEASGVLGLRSGILPLKILLLHTILFVSDSSSHGASISNISELGGLVVLVILGLCHGIVYDLRNTFTITRIW